jgi:DNA modification methylase
LVEADVYLNESALNTLKLYENMREVTFEDFLEFRGNHATVVIGEKEFSLTVPKPKKVEPESFEIESTTVWSFPERGKWATHKYNASYRGNWAPQVARNLIILYSEEGERVLDPFMGSGTTIIECLLLKRKCIGIDINEKAVMLAWSRLEPLLKNDREVRLFKGDARRLDLIEDESIDFVAGHPPYANIIKYSKSVDGNGDLSRLKLESYLESMGDVAKELYRILKPGKMAAIMIGDARSNKHVIPLGYMVMKKFLRAGFTLREHIIKVQHNMVGTIPWMKRNRGFLLLKHEHIFLFEKAVERYAYSRDLPLST